MNDELIKSLKISNKNDKMVIALLKNISKSENLKFVRDKCPKITPNFFFCDGEDLINFNLEKEYTIDDIIDEQGKIYIKSNEYQNSTNKETSYEGCELSNDIKKFTEIVFNHNIFIDEIFDYLDLSNNINMKNLIKNYYFSLKKPKKIDKIDFSHNKTKLDIKNRTATRGKIQLIVANNFQDKYDISSTFIFDIIKYNKEGEIFQIFQNNIDHYKYFNVIFFIYDNIDDTFRFLKSFIEYNDENCIVKNRSDYPFFVFFENKNFNKELLYSYYLKNTKEMDISPFYEIKSHNLIFIKDSKYDVNNLLMNDITNYFYEYDFKTKYNAYNIEFLFMGQTGCGKSTFINYLLGMPRAYSFSTSRFKSRGGVYTHSKYPITITDSEGFEVSDSEQQEKIFKKLEKSINEELNSKTHIAFYLIPGPYNCNRDFDYSIIGPLLKFEQYHILYYVIMTKDPEETKSFAKTSKRFLTALIIKRDFDKVKHDFKDTDLLVQALEKVKSNLENRIFSIDSFKKKSKTIDLLFNQIFKDLQEQKNIMKINIKECFQLLKNNTKFSFNISNNEKASSDFLNNQFKGSKIFFFNLVKIFDDKRRKAEKLIEEAKDISSIRKIFFSYSNKLIENRKKMIEEILQVYDCANLKIDHIEEKLSPKEETGIIYTDELGHKIIEICEEENEKWVIIDRYLGYCKSIDEFGKYKDEFLNFSLFGEKIPYDCNL